MGRWSYTTYITFSSDVPGQSWIGWVNGATVQMNGYVAQKMVDGGYGIETDSGGTPV